MHGKVVLSSGKEADYYVDLRRATLHHAAAPLIGRLLRQLTADWDYTAVGGLTLGMMTRTARAHTGRPLAAGRGELAAFVLVQLAAVVRVFLPMLAPELYLDALDYKSFL